MQRQGAGAGCFSADVGLDHAARPSLRRLEPLPGSKAGAERLAGQQGAGGGARGGPDHRASALAGARQEAGAGGGGEGGHLDGCAPAGGVQLQRAARRQESATHAAAKVAAQAPPAAAACGSAAAWHRLQRSGAYGRQGEAAPLGSCAQVQTGRGARSTAPVPLFDCEVHCTAMHPGTVAAAPSRPCCWAR